MERGLKKYKKVILAILLFALIDAFVWYSIVSARKSREPELYFLNVGQGDSQLVTFRKENGGNVNIVIDAGPDSSLVGELGSVLPITDDRIDIIIITHPQLDHFGGVQDILEKYEVGMIITNGRKAEGKEYNAFMSAIKAADIPHISLMEGDAITYGDTKFEILSPSENFLVSDEVNDSSLVILMTHQTELDEKMKVLYTGDIGFAVEKYITNMYDVDADILKVAHHGSRFSSGSTFLSEVTPEVSIIGVGRNSYGHPTPDAISRLKSVGSEVFTTLENGTIEVRRDDKNIRVFGANPDSKY